jgi:hypothetical protein
LCLTRFEALAGLLLLVRGEDRLAAESDAVRLGVGPAACSAFEDAAALKLGGNAEDGEDDLGKVRGRVEVWLDQRPDTAPARCISRAITRRSVVSRESRSTAGAITTSPGASFFISLPSCGRSAVVPVIFSRNTFPHPAAFSSLTCPLSSWAAVETRA